MPYPFFAFYLDFGQNRYDSKYKNPVDISHTGVWGGMRAELFWAGALDVDKLYLTKLL